MRVVLCSIVMSLLMSVPVEAKPSLKVCQKFALEIESVLKKGDQAISTGDQQAIREQNKRISDLIAKADRMFIQANACNAAAHSASALWSISVQEHQRPAATGAKWVQRRQGDYRDNLELCKQGFEVPH